MRLAPYRSVLRLPGMRMFMLVGLVARIPVTMTSTVLTLSIVLDRHRGYGDAGLVTAAYTIGLTIGSPLLGKLVDRRGPRPVLAVTGAAALVFWFAAPTLPFSALLAVTVLGGTLQVPIMALIRLTIAARVPQEHRRQAYSLDSMAVEVAFMVGPALVILVITQLGDAVSTMHAVGVCLAASAAVMIAYNPKVGAHGRSAADAEAGAAGADAADGADAGTSTAPVRPNWLAPAFLLVLGVTAATTIVLGGTEVSIIATLRAHEQTQWAGLVIIAWCLSSLVGGFIHGAMPKPFSMLTLVALLGALTIPVGLAHDWWLLGLALIPTGMACAPTVASTVDAVTRAIPETARGEALGRHSAALTIGNAAGAPLAGLAIDRLGPAFGFVCVGAVGAALALLAISGSALRRVRHARRPALGAPRYSVLPDMPSASVQGK
jgi:predicted MFS family arabinose efflux permease